MSGKARRITVEFLGDARDLQRATGQAEKSTGRLGGKLKKVGLVAGGALAVGAVVAGKALFDMAKGAAADEAAQARLANQLRNSAKATDGQIAGVEKWISAQGRALGVTDDELRPALARLVTATGDVGKAQKLAALAMDVSAGTGKSLESVSTALMKAQNGNVSALSRLGIQTKNAKGETLSFEQAQKKMAATFKGSAEKNAGTLEGKMARLKLIFDETKETIGAKLLPVLTNLAEWFLDEGLPALQDFGGWIKTNLFPIFAQIAAVVKKALSTIRGDVDGNMGAIRETISNFVSIVRSLWAMFGKDIIRYTKATFNNIRTVVKGVLQVIGGIVKVFSSVLKGDWKGAWEGVKQILRGAMNVIKGLVSQLFNMVGSIIRAGGRLLVAAVKGIPGMLKGLGGLFGSAGKFLIGQFVAGMKNAAGLVSDIAGNVWNAVKGLLNSGIDKINSALEFKVEVLGKGISINPPDIPHLAKGGIVKARRGGVMALIGEGGHDEAVVPLSGPNVPRGGGDETITVNLVLDGKVIHQALVRRKRTLGQNLGLT